MAPTRKKQATKVTRGRTNKKRATPLPPPTIRFGPEWPVSATSLIKADASPTAVAQTESWDDDDSVDSESNSPKETRSIAALKPGPSVNACSGSDIQLSRGATKAASFSKRKGKYLIILPGELSFKQPPRTPPAALMTPSVTLNNKNDIPKAASTGAPAPSPDEENVVEPTLKTPSTSVASKRKDTTTATRPSFQPINPPQHFGRIEGLNSDTPTLTIPMPGSHPDNKNKLVLEGKRVPVSTRFMTLFCAPRKKSNKVVCKDIFDEVIIFGDSTLMEKRSPVDNDDMDVVGAKGSALTEKSKPLESDIQFYGISERASNAGGGKKTKKPKSSSTTKTPPSTNRASNKSTDLRDDEETDESQDLLVDGSDDDDVNDNDGASDVSSDAYVATEPAAATAPREQRSRRSTASAAKSYKDLDSGEEEEAEDESEAANSDSEMDRKPAARLTKKAAQKKKTRQAHVVQRSRLRQLPPSMEKKSNIFKLDSSSDEDKGKLSDIEDLSPTSGKSQTSKTDTDKTAARDVDHVKNNTQRSRGNGRATKSTTGGRKRKSDQVVDLASDEGEPSPSPDGNADDDGDDESFQLSPTKPKKSRKSYGSALPIKNSRKRTSSKKKSDKGTEKATIPSSIQVKSVAKTKSLTTSTRSKSAKSQQNKGTEIVLSDDSGFDLEMEKRPKLKTKRPSDTAKRSTRKKTQATNDKNENSIVNVDDTDDDDVKSNPETKKRRRPGRGSSKPLRFDSDDPIGLDDDDDSDVEEELPPQVASKSRNRRGASKAASKASTTKGAPVVDVTSGEDEKMSDLKDEKNGESDSDGDYHGDRDSPVMKARARPKRKASMATSSTKRKQGKQSQSSTAAKTLATLAADSDEDSDGDYQGDKDSPVMKSRAQPKRKATTATASTNRKQGKQSQSSTAAKTSATLAADSEEEQGGSGAPVDHDDADDFAEKPSTNQTSTSRRGRRTTSKVASTTKADPVVDIISGEDDAMSDLKDEKNDESDSDDEYHGDRDSPAKKSSVRPKRTASMGTAGTKRKGGNKVKLDGVGSDDDNDVEVVKPKDAKEERRKRREAMVFSTSAASRRRGTKKKEGAVESSSKDQNSDKPGWTMTRKKKASSAKRKTADKGATTGKRTRKSSNVKSALEMTVNDDDVKQKNGDDSDENFDSFDDETSKSPSSPPLAMGGRSGTPRTKAARKKAKRLAAQALLDLT